MSVSRPSSHSHLSPSPAFSMEQVRCALEENQLLKAQNASLQAQLDPYLSSSLPPFVLPLEARRTVDSGLSHSSPKGLSPNECVMRVAKPQRTSSVKRQCQSASTRLSSVDILDLSTPVPDPEQDFERNSLLQLMRKAFQAGKSGKGSMTTLHKVCLKLHQCMGLTRIPFELRHFTKVNDCGATASAVSAGGPNCWAAQEQLKSQCGECLSVVSILEKAWEQQQRTSRGFFRRRTSSTSSAN